MLTGQCPIKYGLFLSERKNIIPQWAFRLNSAPADSRNLACKCQYAKADMEHGFYVFEGTIKNKSKIGYGNFMLCYLGS